MAKFDTLHALQIRFASHDYPIYIGHGCLQNSVLLHACIKSKQVLVVTNETIAPLYLQPLLQSLALPQQDVVILRDGEQYKNERSLSQIYNKLIQGQYHRDALLLALGGGVIGDVTGFAASTYQRGVPYIQMPTTLLAQVDAAVGGKTAINHPFGKNMIGTFYHPQAVIMDINVLSTLPERELKSGFAEIIKYGLLRGGALLQDIKTSLVHGFSALTSSQYAKLIADCCKVKAEIIEKDPFESNERMLLNLGHTFAHALEAYTNYERWRHGEAVAIGLYLAALLSCQLGYLTNNYLNMIEKLLNKAELPTRIPKHIDLNRLYDLMLYDKKAYAHQLRFILMKSPGVCFVKAIHDKPTIQHVLSMAVEGDR